MAVSYLVVNTSDPGWTAGFQTELQAATAEQYQYTPTLPQIDSAHSATYKVIPINIPEARRTGVLASIAYANRGVGVYADEFPTIEDFRQFGLPYIGLTGRYVRETRGSWTADGILDHFRIQNNFNPFLAASTIRVYQGNTLLANPADYTVSTSGGQAATNEIMEVKLASVPTQGTAFSYIAEIREPITSTRTVRPGKIQSSIGGTWDVQAYGNADGRDAQNAVAGLENLAALVGLPATGLAVRCLGKQIQQSGNFSTIDWQIRDGTEAAPNYWIWGDAIEEGSRYEGIVMPGAGVDNGDGTWSIPGGLRTDTQFVWVRDPGTAQETELVQVSSQAECASTPDSYYVAVYGGFNDLTAVNIGGDPTNRIMQGGGGYLMGVGNATRSFNRHVNEKVILVNSAASNPPQSDVMYLGGFRKYACRGAQNLFAIDVRDFTSTKTEGAANEYHCNRFYMQDYTFERGKNAIYMIGRGVPRQQFRDFCFVNIAVNDVGGFRDTESDLDGHGIGIQGCDNLIIAGYKGRMNGGDVNTYNITGQTSLLQRFSDFDIDGTAEFFTAPNNDAGLNCGGDGASSDAKSGGIIRSKIINKNRQIKCSWEDMFLVGDPLVEDDIEVDFTTTPKPSQNFRYGVVGFRNSPGPLSFKMTVENVKMGAGLVRWLSLESAGTAGVDWVYIGDNNKFVGQVSDAKIVSSDYGAQTLAQFQANVDAGNTYDPNSVISSS